MTISQDRDSFVVSNEISIIRRFNLIIQEDIEFEITKFDWNRIIRRFCQNKTKDILLLEIHRGYQEFKITIQFSRIKRFCRIVFLSLSLVSTINRISKREYLNVILNSIFINHYPFTNSILRLASEQLRAEVNNFPKSMTYRGENIELEFNLVNRNRIKSRKKIKRESLYSSMI